jgi:Bacterial SH3 domain
MEQAIKVYVSKRVVELGEDAIVSIPDVVEAYAEIPNLAKQKAKTRAMTIAMTGILAMPLLGLMAGDEKLWEKLQSLVETERAAKTQSTVLAVDTAGLSVRSKSSSPTTKELFEQAAMEHLARLHHTFNSWAERDQELMGSVSLKLMVDASGNVVRVDPVNAQINNPSFIQTVMDDVREWKFPNGGTEAAEIIVPLLFIPRGMDPEMIVQWERKVRSGPHDNSPERPLPLATVLPAVSGSEKMAETAVAKSRPIEDNQKAIAVTLPAPSIAPKPKVVAKASVAPKPKAEAKPLPVVIANRQLAIRDNPRYSANSVREVEEATPLSILESHGDWLKVRTAQGGVTGFIRKEYVSPING